MNLCGVALFGDKCLEEKSRGVKSEPIGSADVDAHAEPARIRGAHETCQIGIAVYTRVLGFRAQRKNSQPCGLVIHATKSSGHEEKHREV